MPGSITRATPAPTTIANGGASTVAIEYDAAGGGTLTLTPSPGYTISTKPETVTIEKNTTSASFELTIKRSTAAAGSNCTVLVSYGDTQDRPLITITVN